MFRVPRWWGCCLITVLVAAETGRPADAKETAKKGAPRISAGAPSAIGKAAPARAALPLPVILPPLAPQISPAAASAGLWLSLDPVSGDRVLPTAGQIEDLVRGLEAFRALGGEPIEVTLPDGSRGVYVGRRFSKALIGHVGPMGKVEWSCGVNAPLSATPVVAEE